MTAPSLHASRKTKKTHAGDVPVDWTVTRLEKLANIVRGSSPRPAGTPLYFNGDYLPWITVGDVTRTQGMYLNNTDSFLTEEGAKYTRIIEPGTLLLTNSGATLGVPKITRIRAGANDGVAAFLDVDGTDKEFLYYFLESKTRYCREILAPGVGQPNLNTELIGEIMIALPPLPEQQRITAVLKTWDRAIDQQEELLATKRQFKHGLMQQLLTGKRRFPEFVQSNQKRSTPFGSVPADWDYIHIRDIADEVGEKNTNGARLPVLSCTKHQGLVDSLLFFGKQIFSKDLSTYKLVKRGQYAYATNHIEEGSIGYQSAYDEALISPMYTVFETADRVDDSFFYKLVKTELYRHIFERKTSGTIKRRGSLRWKQFAAIRVALPSLAEQRRIAAVLESCDNEISLLQLEADALVDQKRGLMQKLLTGKVRVQA